MSIGRFPIDRGVEGSRRDPRPASGHAAALPLVELELALGLCGNESERVVLAAKLAAL